MIPYCRILTGTVSAGGQTAKPHFGEGDRELCREHAITFVCLPADSTDKMQLLDVSVFSPMKNAWRGAAAHVPG